MQHRAQQGPGAGGKRTKLVSLLMGREAQDRLSLVAAFQQVAGTTVLAGVRSCVATIDAVSTVCRCSGLLELIRVVGTQAPIP
jgi:hypothetical protein